jgi:alpha-glucosidase
VLVDDPGDGHAAPRRIRYVGEGRADGATLRAARLDAGAAGATRTLRVRVRRADHGATAVRLDGAPFADWSWDERDLSLVVELPDRDDFVLELDYDRTLAASAPPVRVPVEVRVPDGTGPVFVASSATGWAHLPLEPVDAVTWRGELEVPRGAWFFYKFSRGGWETVEKQADCGEVSNRYRFGAASDAQVDAVARWRDDCD